MAVEVILPQLGESVVEGTITKWLVKEGDSVSKEQPLVEVATDKADSEIPAPTAGTVAKIMAPVGATVPVKSVLCLIEPGAPAAVAVAKPTSDVGTPGSQPQPATKRESPVPQPKHSVTLPAGTVARSDGSPTGSAKSAFGGPLASPETRKVARDLGVDTAQLAGSGEHGRITRDDVLRAAAPSTAPASSGAGRSRESSIPSAAPPAMGTTGAMGGNSSNAADLQALINAAIQQGQQSGKSVYVPPIPNVGFGAFKVPPYVEKPGDQIVPFSRRRRLTAALMVYSKNVAPQVVTVAECDLQQTVRLRDQHKDRFKKEGVGLTYLAFVVHATAIALKENPVVNARVLNDAYVVLRDINIGVAVDTKDGLVVPVIRRADGLNVRGIAQAIDEYAVKARDGKLTPDDLSSASFSVSNPGLKGNLFGGAIISQPNVGILRIGELKKRVVVIDVGGTDTIAIHPVMYLALSYDHRIVDGVAANNFLFRVRELLEKGEFEL